MKKIVVAPDSFKGSLSSTEVANAIEKGIKKVIPNCKVVKLPIADGGEGTMDTLVNALKGEKIKITVNDPLMRPVEVEYGLVQNGKTAIIEMATANGLTLLQKEEQDPSITTTFGTGEIIKDALKRNCNSFLIGIGGSATNDGGTGMLKALGFRFLDKKKEETDGTGKTLQSIYSIDESGAISALKDVHFTIACDVNNPFSGPNGAAYVYAPQKGANKQMVKELDEGMKSFAKLINKQKGINLNKIPGAGAAGGLGGAFVAFLNAQLKQGIEMVLEAVEFERELKDADLVITGEGKLDKQTGMGKAANGVLDMSHKKHVPVIALSGAVENIETLNKKGFLFAFSITPKPMLLEDALNKNNACKNITETTEQIIRTIMQFKK